MYRRIFFSFGAVLFYLLSAAQFKVQIQIISVPESAVSDIFLAGSFNGWAPADKNFQFEKKADGKYFLDFSLSKGVYEFKITRGGWQQAECKADGSDITNRVLQLVSDTALSISVEGWKDQFSTTARKSTAGRNVRILDTAFFIPQLNRQRRIWIYLPERYYFSSKRYPVLYMHDGQNVFDDLTSYAGEWGVDECLDTLAARAKECIVIGIDNGGHRRLNEYCPYDFSLSGIAANAASGKGEGKEYAEFLVKTLKPFIDKNYRTLPGRKNTFIAGSSMGGLISMYAVLRYPEVFGGAGVFSPAFWIAPAIFNDIQARGKKVKARIYFYAGDLEGESMVSDTEKAYTLSRQYSHIKNVIVIRKEGRHNEARWRKEFPAFYTWMMQ